MRMTVELYDALVAAGVEETLARKAASVVLGEEDKESLVTKADLANLETRLIKWNLGAMAVLTTIFTAIVTLT